MTVIDEYLEAIEPDKRAELERIRKIAKQAVSDAQDAIAYGMPTLKYKGKSFLGFNVRAKHIGVYPYGGEEIELFRDRLSDLGYGYSSGAIRVPFDKPVPEDLLVEIIQHRIARIA
jgi:uncharacterized protein YdhG (YjbR/CyaY superfamily)